ncbi:MAG TPA: phospho-N-acetylmuramoyl-pentapeptide-transferase [Candidatus Onthocola gallistercoris]|uniref:Phospho-N-acetylmuramoyl-pentapeptide-transferase n=1 Tax=Candidatus Onthocola gallistercoris TaxID=2840876 RepID=A0A9D1HGN2_9FIRM|nr:phospho-N-acetylmuramoyl-pentapeptide-transferase [Candidatus Onthocola gallistercoris]
MKYTIIWPALLAFVISALLGPVIIPFLHKLKFGQYIRDEGPKAHQKKSGTPTMGGVIFIISVVVVALIYMRQYPAVIPIAFTTVGFGVIGFLDDFIKVVKKRNLGLTPFQKLAGQFVITGIFAYYLLNNTDVGTGMLIPFTGGFENGLYLILPWFLFVPLLFFVTLGTVNGTNFTDGLDGLLSSVTVMVAIFFTVVAAGKGSGITPVTAAVAGSLLGFLMFNVYPAKVFMGDTGSLALGGFVASTAYMLNMPLFIVIVGMIYLIEVLSVIIQVVYFKMTGGKRFFKMAPIHHHFELSGWPETKVVAIFTIVTALLCLVGFLAL